ncbi:MAG TPA: glycosyltransferase family 2 protein, partial [Chloroflexota bacterium]
MKLSVLIPAYNEEETIEQIIRSVAAVQLPVEVEILVHDDASTDRTPTILAALRQEMPQLRVIRREQNGGKGVGIRTLIRESRGDACIFQDADEEYDPQDYRRLLDVYR